VTFEIVVDIKLNLLLQIVRSDNDVICLWIREIADKILIIYLYECNNKSERAQ